MKGKAITLVICCLSTPLFAWYARYVPAEANVDWPDPIGPGGRAAVIRAHDVPGGHIFSGRVAVDGIEADLPFLAQLNAQGQVNWSLRLPESIDEGSIFLNYGFDDTVLAVYRVEEGGQKKDIIGTFNAGSGMTAISQFSVPTYEPPQEVTGYQHYLHLSNGDIAIIRQEDNVVKLQVLDKNANPRFARVFTVPEGGGGIPPLPGFQTVTYTAAIDSTESGGYYLWVSTNSFFTQEATIHLLRLSQSGTVTWQASTDLSGLYHTILPLGDGSIAISGSTGFMTPLFTHIVLSPSGSVALARELDGLSFGLFSMSHYHLSGEWLISGTIPTGSLESGYSDAGVILLSGDGNKLHEAAFDLDTADSITSLGTTSGHTYFQLDSRNEQSNQSTYGLLVRSTRSLTDWKAASYLDKAGPSASYSASFSDDYPAFLCFRDDPQEWVYVSQVNNDLTDATPCGLLSPESIVPYDPDIQVNTISPEFRSDDVTTAAWPDPPDRSPYSFDLIELPLTREVACGGNGGTGPVSPWGGLPLYTDGWKKAGMGWILDTDYPHVWFNRAGCWVFIADEVSGSQGIYGYDFCNMRWFWTRDDLGGWHYVWTPTGGWHAW